jgi:hypothetical protein
LGADEPLAEVLILLVSELVTNAVVHTGCPAVLRLLLSGARDGSAGTVRLEMADSSARPPVPRRAESEATNGRGLALVEGLADRWGWSAEGVGKRIWCELDRCAPGARPSAVSAPVSAPVPAPVSASVACEGFAYEAGGGSRAFCSAAGVLGARRVR